MSYKDNNEWAYNIRSYIEDGNLDEALIGLLEKIETLINASNTRSNQISELNERIESMYNIHTQDYFKLEKRDEK